MRKEKIQAIELRKRGRSYLEIQRKLGVSKSTLSYWLKSIVLSSAKRKGINDRAGRKSREALVRRNRLQTSLARERALAIHESAQAEVRRLKKQPLFLIGVSLYWAEGYKQNNDHGWKCVDFTNSDPAMVRLMMKFFREICAIASEKFRVQLMIHAGMNGKAITKYWKQITGIPKKQFLKPSTIISRASKGKRKKRLKYGTIHIRIYDVKFFHRMLGWIEGLKQIYNTECSSVG
ncbi:MAG: helix-turn-helix domain-containing protein [Candidatus Magasanikbacteria bacterium]|nr:helix-turn-helix domain-containing protein [Candidatus Magasanikbacteria bacterium]